MKKNDMFSLGNENFKESYFKNHSQELLDLVENGQHPKALFIGCADSRVVPELITGAAPGDLFIIRNVGNFIAPYDPDTMLHASAPGIEYAVTVLEVSHIIICGHTHCGAIHSLFKEIDNPSLIHTKNWLSLGNSAKSFSLLALGKDADKEKLYRLTEKLSLASQVENLLTYPDVKKGIENNTLHIHGWVYDIESGEIEYYDPDMEKFRSLSALAKGETEEYAQAMPMDAFSGNLLEGDDLNCKVYVESFDDSIFSGLNSHFAGIIADLPELKVIVLRMENVPYMDQSDVYTIEEAVLELEKREIEVFVTGIQMQPEDMLRQIKLIPEVIKEESLFKDFKTFKRFVTLVKNDLGYLSL